MARPNEIAKPSSIVTLASITVVVAALYLAKGVLVPLTLAVLLSFLLIPVCDWLERRKLGRIPAVLLTAVLSFSVLAAVAWTAAIQMTGLFPNIPDYQKNIEAKLNSVNAYAVAALSKVTRTAQAWSTTSRHQTRPTCPRERTNVPSRSTSCPCRRDPCKSSAACSARCLRRWEPPASSSCLWCSSWFGARICAIDLSTWLEKAM